MSKSARGRPPDIGECRVWPAIVLATSAEGLIEIDCPSLADTPIVNVPPELITPLMWVPEVGDGIEVVEVAGDEPVRWRGWAPAAQEDTTEQEEGATVLTSPGRELSIGLDDGVDDDDLEVDGDGESLAEEPQRVWVGRKTATERAVLGNAQKLWLKDQLTTLDDIRFEAEGLASAAGGIATDVGIFATALGSAVDPVVVAAATTLLANMTSRASQLSAIQGNLLALGADIAALETQIEAHLSRLVKISRE